MTGAPWRRRLPRVRALGSEPRDRETGMPQVVIACRWCGYDPGPYLFGGWTNVLGIGWLCPKCSVERERRSTLRYRLVTRCWDVLAAIDAWLYWTFGKGSR